MRDYILETENLTKRYGNDGGVMDVNLKVRRQGIYGLLGPNGAGKSTILKLIVGLLRPTEGKIFFEGHPMSREDLSEVGALIESPALYPNLTARENLKVQTLLSDLPDERIREVLDVVDLKNTGNKKVGQFSMGMKQRLGIAAALLNRPKLLILDEPVNGLDPFGIRELRELIRRFPEEGMTVILSSHILPEVAKTVDTLGILHEGKLIYQGEPDPGEDLETFFMNTVGGAR